MSKEVIRKKHRAQRRRYSEELKAEAVQMVLDGHSAASVAANLGLSTLKTELEMRAYSSERTARKEIPDYIRYYNTRRRHSALAYQTPQEFERPLSR